MNENNKKKFANRILNFSWLGKRQILINGKRNAFWILSTTFILITFMVMCDIFYLSFRAEEVKTLAHNTSINWPESNRLIFITTTNNCLDSVFLMYRIIIAVIALSGIHIGLIYYFGNWDHGECN